MGLRDLTLRLRALLAPRRAEQELDEELAFHIEREAQTHIAHGVGKAEALRRARVTFGSVALAADQCRDARGIGAIDTLARDVAYAFRAFRRAPLAACTIVATVGLGLGLITVVFTVYTAVLPRVDAVSNPDELFEIERPTRPDLPASTTSRAWHPYTRPEYETLRRDARVLTDVAGVRRLGASPRSDNRPSTCTLVTGNFFQLLGVRAALGRTLTPADDTPGEGRRAIVLSHRGWHKLFDADPAVVGRTKDLYGMPFEIVGVMPSGFRGLEATAPDYWAPLALASELPEGGWSAAFMRERGARERETRLHTVIGRLKPGVTADAAMASLSDWELRRRQAGQTELKPVRRLQKPYIMLRPSQGARGDDRAESLKLFLPIFFAFGLILLIGCANVANLLLARGVSRHREIGVRLALGASRPRIIRQLFTESVVLAAAAAAAGLAISRLLLNGAITAIGTMMPEFAEQTDLVLLPAAWPVLLFLIVAAFVSTLVFGLTPALRSSRVELVRTMRGEIARDARPGRARQALIGVQVAAAALLLICASLFLRGTQAAAATGPGLRTSDTVIVPITNEPRRAAMVAEVRAHPSVAMVAASSPDAVMSPGGVFMQTVPDRPGESPRRIGMETQFVSPEYFAVVGIVVVQGRGFTAAERTPDAGVVIVSERGAKRLWPDGDPLGRVVRVERMEGQHGVPMSPPRTYTVVGVTRDVGGVQEVGRGSWVRPIFTTAALYLPIAPETEGTSLTVRVRGDLDDARAALVKDFARAEGTLGDIRTMRAASSGIFDRLRLAFWATTLLAGLALVLTLSGLYSVLAYIVEQRTKEIGVHMVLGATVTDAARMVIGQSLRPVLAGLAAGAALAAGLMKVLRSIPITAPAFGLGSANVGSTAADLVRVFDPFAYAASLLVIAIACVAAASIPAVRASRIDPSVTLRAD